MVVLILESVSPSLRGELTRWLLQPRAGVFVGKVSALVRDKLWEKVSHARQGGGILLYSNNTEQGFSARTFGDPSRCLVDFEGVTLARTPRKG